MTRDPGSISLWPEEVGGETLSSGKAGSWVWLCFGECCLWFALVFQVFSQWVAVLKWASSQRLNLFPGVVPNSAPLPAEAPRCPGTRIQDVRREPTIKGAVTYLKSFYPFIDDLLQIRANPSNIPKNSFVFKCLWLFMTDCWSLLGFYYWLFAYTPPWFILFWWFLLCLNVSLKSICE